MHYIASKGDTWDTISYKSFGDEFMFPQIMEINRKYSDVVIFDGGEIVQIPDRVIVENIIVSTPWKTDNAIRVIQTPWG